MSSISPRRVNVFVRECVEDLSDNFTYGFRWLVRQLMRRRASSYGRDCLLIMMSPGRRVGCAYLIC